MKMEERMERGTFANAKMAVPNAAGIIDVAKAFEQSHAAGNWILLSPDGRLWEHPDPMRMFAVIAAVLQNDPMTRMTPNAVLAKLKEEG